MEQFISSVQTSSRTPIPSLNDIIKQCPNDVLCAALLIKAYLGPKARLEKITHPDTDTIRRVKNQPSLSDQKWLSHNILRFSLNRFGRKAVSEITTAYSNIQENDKIHPPTVIVDLRNNHGGTLKRMLRVASLFLGAIPGALKLNGKDKEKMIAVPGYQQKLEFRNIKLIVGPNTASSAEIFAALLAVHAKARITGKRTFGKNYLLRIIPVNHDWQLLVPAEIISVPGTKIAGGIVPDKNR